MTDKSNTRAAIERALHDFENRERGIPQAHMAAGLVAELRAALAAQPTSEPVLAEPPEGMRWFYCTTDVKEVYGHQVWRVAGRDLADAQARYAQGDGDITDQDLEVTDLDEPDNWSPKA